MDLRSQSLSVYCMCALLLIISLVDPRVAATFQLYNLYFRPEIGFNLGVVFPGGMWLSVCPERESVD